MSTLLKIMFINLVVFVVCLILKDSKENYPWNKPMSILCMISLGVIFITFFLSLWV